jgi:sugar phosphate isomerase/epimerase
MAECAEGLGLQAMVENLPDLSESDEMSRLISDPRLGFHLDIAHAAMGKGRWRRLMDRFWARLVHVHLSDNSTLRDDHLPLGAGRVDWRQAVSELKRRGYDAVITLEVFSNDRDLLLYSRDLLQRVWDEC